MEQITKIDGEFYYGDRLCTGPEDVYCRFRNDYNAATGRAAYRRLGRILRRTERIHEYGFIFDEQERIQMEGKKIQLTLLGLVCGSYCWMLDGKDIPGNDEEDAERWIDLIFEKGCGIVYKKGKSIGSGRKSRRLKTRYR